MPTPLADALLLTCFDFRLPPLIAQYMETRGLSGRYDHVALAGASLGLVHPPLGAWRTTVEAQVQAALDLHGITRMLLLDHRDCGAYRVFLGQDVGADPAAETAVHTTHLHAARDLIAARWPALTVEVLLLDLDGSVAAVP